MNMILLMPILLFFSGVSIFSPASSRLTLLCDDKFLERVLTDFSLQHSNYIALDVESDEFSGRIIIENEKLFAFLNRSKGLTEKAYVAFMKDILSKKGKLQMGNAKPEEIGFEKVTSLSSVDANADKSRETFTAHYFPKGVITSGVSAEEVNSIINKLFEWHVATFMDDETGLLRLEKEMNANQFVGNDAVPGDEESPSKVYVERSLKDGPKRLKELIISRSKDIAALRRAIKDLSPARTAEPPSQNSNGPQRFELKVPIASDVDLAILSVENPRLIRNLQLKIDDIDTTCINSRICRIRVSFSSRKTKKTVVEYFSVFRTDD
ncbi:MAG TPA: hypothetical protein VK468_08750, partial [Pyrinomonadaceae bacterium]|nr:hypothetical protein [Pyrinomonadaceae bacterium]